MFLCGFRVAFERCFGNRPKCICICIECCCLGRCCCCTSLSSLFFDSMGCPHAVASILVVFLIQCGFLNDYLCDLIQTFRYLGYLCSRNSGLTTIDCAALLMNSFLATFACSSCDSDDTRTICRSFLLLDSNEPLSEGGRMSINE